jgi:FixJ family two-component response regulator
MDTQLPWIALVDDETGIRRALLRLMRAAGIPALAYANGDELLAALPAGAPSCAVLDIHMPGMSGLDLQRSLAALTPATGVIFMTGHHTPEERELAQLQGALAFLLKPVNDVQLLEAIAAACPALSPASPASIFTPLSETRQP